MREFDAVDLFSIDNESNSVTGIIIFWPSPGQRCVKGLSIEGEVNIEIFCKTYWEIRCGGHCKLQQPPHLVLMSKIPKKEFSEA